MLPRTCVVVLLAASAASCGGSPTTAPALLTPTGTGAAFESESCSAFRPPTEPDLMGWDSGSRANLKTKREQGVVAVRYKAEGCNVELEVLNCTGEGEYKFSPYSASDTKVSKSTRDLYADLPIGAARLGAKVGNGRALRTDYMMTGVYSMASYDAYPVSKLRGSGCDEATHVVAQMYVGGFAMASGATESLQGGASVFGVGVDASQDRSTERVAAEGNREACERAQKDGTAEALCSVPLRVGLVPVQGRADGSCPAGSDWDGTTCVQKQMRTEIVCPAGTTLNNGACVGAVNTDCPSGTSFAVGVGCMATVNTECGPGLRFEGGRGCLPVSNPSPATAVSSTPVGGGTMSFDRAAAQQQLASAVGAAKSCRSASGPFGSTKVLTTFAPNGRVTNVNVGPPFAGTPVGSCIAQSFRTMSVPAFGGSPVVVAKTVAVLENRP